MNAQYKNNVREGEEFYYYPNGNILSSGFYKNNFKTGVWKYYFEDGSIDTTINFNE